MAEERKLIYKDEARAAVLRENPAAAWCIDRIKPVAAVEVVHGRWDRLENKYIDMFKCSVCRSECCVPTCMTVPMYDYCPYCGAKMDGGNEDDFAEGNQND